MKNLFSVRPEHPREIIPVFGQVQLPDMPTHFGDVVYMPGVYGTQFPEGVLADPFVMQLDKEVKGRRGYTSDAMPVQVRFAQDADINLVWVDLSYRPGNSLLDRMKSAGVLSQAVNIEKVASKKLPFVCKYAASVAIFQSLNGYKEPKTERTFNQYAESAIAAAQRAQEIADLEETMRQTQDRQEESKYD